ncbi:MAG: chitobiase/beta-hexosaminidase C-terminal domain-containing protein [Marinilabiliaceae bacterium]|nr:chitobiase/beta-hexosaminidase C-terminal domain-containing protein [Marinilabiliaceae bacterium]
MKRNVRIFAVAALAAFASAATAQTVLFEETFDKCSGTGGNDGSWSGTVAGSKINATNPYADNIDNEGWTFTPDCYIADKCIRLGTGKAAGSVTTPALSELTSDAATLTFRAGAWNSASDGTTLSISISGDGASLSVSSVTLERGAFNTYTVKISGGLETSKITFTTSAKRFFLDDVKIVSGWVDEEIVETPEISATATDFEESTTVTITAEEGAAIYYTTDGTTPTAESTAYSAPFDVTATATVKAIAVKGGKTSIVASLALTKVDVTSMTFAEAYDWCLEQDYTKSVKHDGYVKITFEDAKVLYVDESAIFVRQGEMAMQFYGFPTSEKAVVVNDILNGTYAGQLQAYKGIPELSASTKITTAANVTVTNSEEAAAAISATVAEIEARTYICDFVELTNVTFTKDDQDYFWVNSGDNDVEVKVTNDLIPEEYVNKLYNVKAVVSSTYKNEGVLALLSCEYVGEVSPEDPGTVTAVAGVAAELDENAPIYNLQGQRVSKDAKGILIQNGKKFVVK